MGDQVLFDVQLASGEHTNHTASVTKFVNDGVNLIIDDATLAIISTKEAAATIPVIGTSVTDYASPEAATVASNEIAASIKTI